MVVFAVSFDHNPTGALLPPLTLCDQATRTHNATFSSPRTHAGDAAAKPADIVLGCYRLLTVLQKSDRLDRPSVEPYNALITHT